MSRGPGTHQREIMRVLTGRGWAWVAELPYRSRSDYTSYWRAIRRLEEAGRLRVEHRHRHWCGSRRALLVSVLQFPSGTAIPIDEPYYPEPAA
jgi:hypothetical protein